MTDDTSPIEGIEVIPAWSDHEGHDPAIFIILDEFYPYGDAVQTRGLMPDEARGLARHLTLMAEVAERGRVHNPEANEDRPASTVFITPSMQTRLDQDTARTNRILIVEGTEQNISMTAYVPDDVVAVSFQGRWGRNPDKVAVAELEDLCKGRDVIVSFDVDASSNQKVYDEASALTITLLTIGAKSVRFLKVPGSKSIGLEDFITRRPMDRRAESLAAMITGAIPFTKVRPPRRFVA